MSTMSPQLELAMQSSCATGVEEVIEARRPEDLATLRALLTNEDAPASARQNNLVPDLQSFDRDLAPRRRDQRAGDETG